MKRFIYKAKDTKTGKNVKGSIQAENERTAGKLLIEQGYMPTLVTEESAEGFLQKMRNKVSAKDRIVFTRQFSTLIGAGLPLSNSLRTVADQTESKPMKSVIENILASVEAGKSLGVAFSQHPDVFDNVYLSLIDAGEMSGTLDDSLRRLAEQQERDAEIMSKIRGAMTYPMIVLMVIFGVIIFMMIVVVPQVENLYKDLGQELPTLTLIMVALANFLINFWWLIILLGGGTVWLLLQFRKTDVGTKFFARLKLHVPMFNGMFRRLYMARFARTAQILLATGVPMLDTLRIAGNAMNNVIVNEQIQEVMTKVKAGKSLSSSLKERDYILPLVPQMASIGEESGKVDEMLGKSAQVYEDELDEKIRTLSTMIEPLLMVVMAVLVGGIVGAILFPIYSLVNSV